MKAAPRNKYDFIQEILENTKLTSAQKERVFLMTKEEIKADGLIGKKLEERVKRLEKNSLTNNSILQAEKSINTNRQKETTYKSPKNLYNFLKDINQNTLLKSVCHEIDSNELQNILEICGTEYFDFLVYREKIQSEYHDNFMKNGKYFVDHRIKNLILAYLTGDTYSKKNQGWTNSESIKFNWNSPELKQWCLENPDKVPHPDRGFKRAQGNAEFKLPKPIKSNLIKNKNIQFFSELVLHFKYLFHIRSDNSLRSIIEYQNKKKGWNEKYKFKILEPDFPDNIEFFTNVEVLIECYYVLIGLIDEVVEKKGLEKAVIKLKLTEKDTGIEFSIHHLNSVFGKSINNTIERSGTTIDNLIKHQINGMCDFFINADFGNEGNAQINIWDGKPKVSKSIANFEGGVEYLLIFRK